MKKIIFLSILLLIAFNSFATESNFFETLTPFRNQEPNHIKIALVDIIIIFNLHLAAFLMHIRAIRGKMMPSGLYVFFLTTGMICGGYAFGNISAYAFLANISLSALGMISGHLLGVRIKKDKVAAN